MKNNKKYLKHKSGLITEFFSLQSLQVKISIFIFVEYLIIKMLFPNLYLNLKTIYYMVAAKTDEVLAVVLRLVQ